MQAYPENKLVHGLPAVFRNGYWVVFSQDFSNIARIELGREDLDETFAELRDGGFFEAPQKPLDNVIHLTLIITNGCNLRCKYCFADAGDREESNTISYDVASAALDLAVKKSNGRKLSISFFGGEPTIKFKTIRSIVLQAEKISKNKGLPYPEFSITSNGVFGRAIHDFLVKHNFLITLSVDGPSFIQDFQRPSIRGGSSFAVERTLRRFADRGYKIKVRATVTQKSVWYMSDIVSWLSHFGLVDPEVHFEPVSISGRARLSSSDLDKPKVEDFIINLKAAIYKGNEVGVAIVNSSFMNLANNPSEFCESDINNRFAVTTEGFITRCVEVQDRLHPAHKLLIMGEYDKNSKGFITKGTEKPGVSKPVRFMSYNGFSCLSCFASPMCGGGCPVRNFHTTGKTSVVDPYRCTVIREIVPFVYGMIDDESVSQP